MLQKYGRHGIPKYHYFRLAAEDTELQWESKNVSGQSLAWQSCACRQHSMNGTCAESTAWVNGHRCSLTCFNCFDAMHMPVKSLADVVKSHGSKLCVSGCMQGRIRRVPLTWVVRFQRGQDTDVFRRYPQPQRVITSFSVIYIDA